ncbi:MAG TPA: phospholipase D-like domain-containing protein [Usitatibacter sp.]|nr:phospholipase D-like domain-containing protein [Usitatibacter sp.]
MIRAFALAALLAVSLPVHARGPESARIEVAFTPGEDVSDLIARRIARARESVRMQAYLFNDWHIAGALFAAMRRGVEVQVVADAAQHASGGLPVLAPLRRAGAHVYLDADHAASHNKIVIVDGATVITGSYNFTQAAQSRNAENVVVISGSRAIADRFVKNFEYHRSQSAPWP